MVQTQLFTTVVKHTWTLGINVDRADRQAQYSERPLSTFQPSKMTEIATFYFAYGSNLWREQMDLRCPENNFLGVGLLKEWRWIINGRGYANVVPSKEAGDNVYGFLYKINAKDQDVLDVYEGVPTSYQKKILPVTLLRTDGKDDKIIHCLVYVDTERVLDSIPKDEYIERMNKGITDAVKEGVPKDYIDKYLRQYIPDEH